MLVQNEWASYRQFGWHRRSFQTFVPKEPIRNRSLWEKGLFIFLRTTGKKGATTMANEKIRVKLKSYDHTLADAAAAKIVDGKDYYVQAGVKQINDWSYWSDTVVFNTQGWDYDGITVGTGG